tara:strand:+ start:64 stop:186 length:123 start_codon:yes stop_codon:yes gene_type:complete
VGKKKGAPSRHDIHSLKDEKESEWLGLIANGSQGIQSFSE